MPSDADPDPGSGLILSPGSGILDGKNPKSGSGMNILDVSFRTWYQFFSTFWGLKILKFFDAHPDPGSEINIPDPQHYCWMFSFEDWKLLLDVLHEDLPTNYFWSSYP